eukprot:CAMPEP_0175956594 /NCGR_PEP_ID=MMETSP0108-20121206/33171_1 /TAXON_ID=195067 ORGANISM="Goniomonas pacifica, Strain CCMP1869" /NCGR_SAMPLE_ID=MMETSP0108 /ASSEMBLY_ACC=CAM_ASM_000204 /LENGTH=110 /DNA_ID=CAMNT_0017283639 /DNA_START=441 /DNA_END=770 /DNA_ORIENTATION=-
MRGVEPQYEDDRNRDRVNTTHRANSGCRYEAAGPISSQTEREIGEEGHLGAPSNGVAGRGREEQGEEERSKGNQVEWIENRVTQHTVRCGDSDATSVELETEPAEHAPSH